MLLTVKNQSNPLKKIFVLWKDDFENIIYAANCLIIILLVISVHSNVTESNKTGLILIGAGLPRTGTSSTKLALEQLLGGRCYHNSTCMQEEGWESHFQFWVDILSGKMPCTPESMRKMFTEGNFKASLDHPASQFYKILMEAFPDAKVLLTVREPEKWYKSAHGTIYQSCVVNNTKPPLSWVSRILNVSRLGKMCVDVNPGMYEALGEGEKSAVEFYSKWVEQVKADVPADRLLVFSVKEGWEPLCKFLNVPVPENEFPNVWDSVTVKKVHKRSKAFMWSVFIVGVSSLVGVSAFVLAHSGLAAYTIEQIHTYTR